MDEDGTTQIVHQTPRSAPTTAPEVKTTVNPATTGRPRVGVNLKPKQVWVQTPSGRSRRVSNSVKEHEAGPRPHRYDANKPKMADFVPLESLKLRVPPVPVHGGSTFLTRAFDNLIIKVSSNDPELYEINLKGNRITNEGCFRLANALASNDKVRVLDMSNNRMDDDGSAAVCRALQSNESVEKLVMTGSMLGLRLCDSLGNMIEQAAALQVLTVNTGIPDAGVLKFAPALAFNKSLKTLGLSNNYIGDQGGVALAKALQDNHVLVQLELSKNWLTDGSVECEEQVMPGKKETFGFARLILENICLESIDFSMNKFSDSGGGTISSALDKNQDGQIQWLDFDFCRLSGPIKRKITESISKRKAKREELWEAIKIQEFFALATTYM